MPVRRRVDRRRAETLAAWRGTFQSGFDFFDDLKDVGVPTDEYGRPASELALDAWRRFGEMFLADYSDYPPEPWALREFGPPNGGTRRAS